MIDSRRTVGQVVGVAVAVVALLVLAVLITASVTRPDPADAPTVLSFTDEHGRTCTQTSTPSAVALDCDYPPAENRLGGWLDTLNTKETNP